MNTQSHAFQKPGLITGWIDPDDVHPKHRELVEEYNRLDDAHDEARNRLAQAEETIRRAPDEDANSHLEAIQQGKKTPGTPAQDAAATQHRAAIAHMQAIDTLYRLKADETATALRAEENAEHARTHANNKLAETLTGYEAAIEQSSKLILEAATKVEAALVIHGFADDLSDPRAPIGYGTSPLLERSNLEEGRATALKLRRTYRIENR